MASGKQTIDGTSIVEMEILDGDQSDYEVDLSGPMGGSRESDSRRRGVLEEPAGEDGDGFMGVSKSQVASGVATYVWEEGRQRARKAFSVYGNIDILRPYFDVEPHTVRNRLVHSLIPRLPRSGQHEKVPRELYGPTMVVLTLIALLLFQMKSSGHTVEEGTLMGSAFGVCFTYWFGTSGLLWFLAYVCNTHISSLQILSLLGYALFGHCVVLFASTMFHSHTVFYLLWLTVGGLAALRVIFILVGRTTGRTQRLIVCGATAALHLLFLLYLHFAYHQIVEELSVALSNDRAAMMPAMVQESQAIKDLAPDAADSVNRVVREAGIPHKAGIPDDVGIPALNKTGNRAVAGDHRGNRTADGILEAIRPQYNQLHPVPQRPAVVGVNNTLHVAVNKATNNTGPVVDQQAAHKPVQTR